MKPMLMSDTIHQHTQTHQSPPPSPPATTIMPSFKPEDNPNPARPTTTKVLRKKGTGARAWLFLDSTGQGEVLEAGKYSIMRRTGIPARDLRILDPLLSYPSTILGRERAIVIGLEHIKAIVTAHEVLLLNSRDPAVTPFVDELQKRLSCYQATKAQEGNGDVSSRTNLYDLVEPRLRDARPGNASKILPFEFVVLEACLETVCNSLENEGKTLEQEAYPILDKLTSKISNLNLERVRQLKSRLVSLTGRVHKVRDELEHLLDDDKDMAEMYLTDKLAQQQLENSSDTSSISERDDMDDEVTKSDMGDRTPAEITSEDDFQNTDSNQDNLFKSEILVNVGELEMLLEAYFVQIDGTLNKLSALREYVDDTEDFINMMLDDKQNSLLKMGIVMTTATLVLSFFIVLCGLLGMNIHIGLWEQTAASTKKFVWTIIGGCIACALLYGTAIGWYKQKRLI